MKPRLPLRLRPIPSRSYATRLPERPPYRAPDPLKNNPHAKYEALSERLTFIRRPPPTAPTPFSYTTSPSSPLLRQSPSLPVSRVCLPPSLHPDKPQPSRMSDEDIATMRKLRAEDPSKWTRSLLAKKFNCTPHFVAMIAPLDNANRRAALAKMDQEHEEARAKWGERKSLSRDIAKERRKYW